MEFTFRINEKGFWKIRPKRPNGHVYRELISIKPELAKAVGENYTDFRKAFVLATNLSRYMEQLCTVRILNVPDEPSGKNTRCIVQRVFDDKCLSNTGSSEPGFEEYGPGVLLFKSNESAGHQAQYLGYVIEK